MDLKTDYRKIRAAIIIGCVFWVISGIAYLKLEGTGKAVWTWFFLLSGLLIITIGLLVKSRFKLTDTYLEVNNVFGWGRKKINLSDVLSTKSIDREFPVTFYLNNLLWLILMEKKFKRNMKFKLFGTNGRLLTIDGHLLADSDYEFLKKKLKKSAYRK